MDKYEYISGYLLAEEAANVNNVTEMLNDYGDNGWLFTGHSIVVVNGTFYMFVRPKV